VQDRGRPNRTTAKPDRSGLAAAAGAALAALSLGILPSCGAAPRVAARHSLSVSAECGGVDGCSASCESGKLGACYAAGVLYEVGEGTPQSYPEAARFYERACEGGEPRGCNNLGVMREIGLGQGQDYAAAAGLYRRACEGGDGQGCSNLALKYEEGLGVGRDPGRAKELYGRACSLGSEPACQQGR